MYRLKIYILTEQENPEMYDSLEDASEEANQISNDETLVVIVDDEGNEVDYV